MIVALGALIFNAILCSAFASTADTFLIGTAVIMAAAIMRQDHETHRR